MGIPKMNFSGKVAHNAQRQKLLGTGADYLNIPKGINIFKEFEGRIHLDILPYLVTDELHGDRDDNAGVALPNTWWYRKPYKLHRSIGVNNESLVCPTSFKKPCPICEYRTQQLNAGVEYDELRPLRASDRSLYIVVPLDVKDFDEKPYLWDMSDFLFQKKLNDELSEDESYELFPDANDGLTLKIRFAEESIGKTKFYNATRIDFEKREHLYEEDVLSKLPNLDKVLHVKSYDVIKDLFWESVDTGDEKSDNNPFEDDETPIESIRKKKTATPKEHKDDPEEEPDSAPQKDAIITKQDMEIPVSEEDTGSVQGSNKEEEVSTPDKSEIKRTRTKTSPKEEAQESVENPVCPVDGDDLGINFDKFEECAACELWEPCMDAFDKKK